MSEQLPSCLLVSGDANHLSIINQLKISSRESSMKFIHAGGKNSDIDISILNRLSGKNSLSDRLENYDYFRGEANKLIELKNFSNFVLEGISDIHRGSRKFFMGRKSFKFIDLPFYECRNYYHISADILGSLLVENNVRKIVFFNFPHLYYDTVLYHIAKVTGVQTLIVTQSLFPNVYYSLCSVSDTGNLPPNLPHDEIVPIEINPNSTPDWYYMKKIKQGPTDQGKFRLKAFFKLIRFLLGYNPVKILNFISIFQLIKRMNKIASTFPKWREPFTNTFHFKQLEYFETLAKYETNQIDLNRKFVYFPLQMQPEMTTSSIGGHYSDQVLALEKLANILPNDMFIYLKENPKQSSVMRGPMFFQRIDRIKSVKFVPSFANTHELTSKSEFVATVTGTVGWEAIRIGKKALVFGMPWYRSFPGVIEFSDDLTFEEISDYSFEHSSLERYFGWLISRAHVGTIDPRVDRRLENFDPKDNVKNVTRTILDLLQGQINTTFEPTQENNQE